MNILLFEPFELAGSLLSLAEQDRRAQHIVRVLGLAPGDDLRVGMLNGKMGTARILGLENGRLDMEVSLATPPPEPAGIELILALPRPIMLQRILKQATVLGSPPLSPHPLAEGPEILFPGIGAPGGEPAGTAAAGPGAGGGYPAARGLPPPAVQALCRGRGADAYGSQPSAGPSRGRSDPGRSSCGPAGLAPRCCWP